MAEKICETDLKREKEYLYFVKEDDKKNLCIYRAKLKRGGTKKGKK